MSSGRRVRVRVALPAGMVEALELYARRRGLTLDEALEEAVKALLEGRFKKRGLGSLPRRCGRWRLE